MSSNRYVLVGWDIRTGEIYVSAEMLKTPYNKREAQEFLNTFSDTLRDIQDFMILPLDQALCLWTTERNGEFNRTDN